MLCTFARSVRLRLQVMATAISVTEFNHRVKSPNETVGRPSLSRSGTCRSSILAVLIAAGVQLLIIAPGGKSVAASFTGLGEIPGHGPGSQARGISNDGTVVVGWGAGDGFGPIPEQAFVWQNGSMTGLGTLLPTDTRSKAWGISGDGSTIVGDSNPGDRAVRWIDGSIEDISNRPGDPLAFQAFDASEDGSIVVGRGSIGCCTVAAFVWDNGNLSVLGSLPGWLGSGAQAVSDDGTVITGIAGTLATGSQAFRWENGELTEIGLMSNGGTAAQGLGISVNGAYIVGSARDVTGFVWSSVDGAIAVDGIAEAYGVSDDGQTVVGTGCSGPTCESTSAVIWDRTTGSRFLKDLLELDHGLDLAGWSLLGARAITPDGLTIIGFGVNPFGVEESWIAVIPNPRSGQTNPGTNVSVEPPALDENGDPIVNPAAVILVFDDVTGSGVTTVTITEAGPPPDGGLRLGNPPTYFDLETTATFTGAVEVCIDYSGLSFGGPASGLSLRHRVGNIWEDATVSNDTVTMIICASVTSFSFFAIFEAVPVPSLEQFGIATLALSLAGLMGVAAKRRG